MRQFGLIGYPLSHSFSKGYFTDKFLAEDIRDCHYENYPISSIHQLPDLLSDHPNLTGLNVTIPYKESVIPYLNDLDEISHDIGAVNTIKINDGKLTGYNTDQHGFTASLVPLLDDIHVEALILGTGGASMAVAYSLEQLKIPFDFVSRTKKKDCISYGELTSRKVRNSKLIINTTPLGMYPDINESPDIPYDGIGEDHVLYDLVYNPETTRFLAEGKNRGARIKNGLEMLHLQAEKAWEIWNDS